MSLLRAWLTLVVLSLRRMFFSLSTLMVLFPLAACTLYLLHRDYGSWTDSREAFHSFGQFMIDVFANFLLPICALAYGTSSVGGEREDRTLLYVLVRPIPRGMILLGKFCASLPPTLGIVLASYFLYCRLAGGVGDQAWWLFLPAVCLSALSYLCVFHLFAVMFRHATIVALLYALFMELLLGNMPGMIKRVAVNFYARSLIYGAGAPLGLKSPNPWWFEPISAASATWTLVAISVVSLLAALVIFQSREYRDLS